MEFDLEVVTLQEEEEEEEEEEMEIWERENLGEKSEKCYDLFL